VHSPGREAAGTISPREGMRHDEHRKISIQRLPAGRSFQEAEDLEKRHARRTGGEGRGAINHSYRRSDAAQDRQASHTSERGGNGGI
jgi:hypothetical protein